MVKATSRDDLIKAAQYQLEAAGRALLHANTLFEILQYALTSGNPEAFGMLSIVEIGKDLTGTCGERTESEASFFAGANHD